MPKQYVALMIEEPVKEDFMRSAEEKRLTATEYLKQLMDQGK